MEVAGTHLPSFLLILLFTVYLLPLSSSTNTITTTFASACIVVQLTHADAHMNLTYQEHIHAAINRTHHRAQQLSRHTGRGRDHHRNSSSQPQQATTLNTSLQGYNGEYFMKLEIGTPPTSFTASIDTGSNLIWAKCYHPTNEEDDPLFDPQSSSSYSKVPCSDPICNNSRLHTSCNALDCGYTIKYVDGTGSEGTLSLETFTLGSLTANGIRFGCSSVVNGFEATGPAIVGMNKGPLSLITQLGPLIGYQFSYCLGGYSAFDKSKLTLGPSSHLIKANTTTSTPLLMNPGNQRQYFVTLLGISVGGKRLPISESAFQVQSDGSGGVLVDSGSTFTGLVEEAYKLVHEAFLTEVGQQFYLYNPDLRLDACLNGLPDSISIPTLTFHFDGGDLQVPLENYIVTDSRRQLSCLAILPTPGEMNIIGSTLQQNFLVHYDLGKNMISFTPAQCSSL
ncbi:aspartic proteinase nepenthesin-1-like [Nymphaea colorata]|nr:aspartic proteinase nepenthesin-1-like [Nymphaea colorata]